MHGLKSGCREIQEGNIPLGLIVNRSRLFCKLTEDDCFEFWLVHIHVIFFSWELVIVSFRVMLWDTAFLTTSDFVVGVKDQTPFFPSPQAPSFLCSEEKTFRQKLAPPPRASQIKAVPHLVHKIVKAWNTLSNCERRVHLCLFEG